MAGETDGDVLVPPTLQALLAARLDQLETAERSVLERGSIEGEIFHRGAVQALAPEETQVTPRLAALVRKQLIGPDRTQLAGEDGFRFRHLLIRDAAYDALPKATRAELHQRFAAWMEQHGAGLVELDEILGYHLEQACKYRAELGLPDGGILAAAARRRLTDAGHRASRRQDYGGAVSLFERAAALVPETERDFALEIQLGDALFWTGRSDEAHRRTDALAERALAAGDRVGELCARLMGGIARLELERGGERLAALVEQALPVFQAADDHLALYLAYDARASIAWKRAQMDAGLEAYERAAAHARAADYFPPGLVGSLAGLRFFGTTPASVLLTWLDENEPPAGRDHFLRAYRAGALGMLGRFDEARAILAESRAELAAPGTGVLLANITCGESVWLELWAGDPAAAAEFGSEGWNLLQELEDQPALHAGSLAQAFYGLDQIDEADTWAGRSAELGASDDVWKEMLWRQVRSKVLARRGEHAGAEQLAREAIAICDETEMLSQQGDAYADLAEVLILTGKPNEAGDALEQALNRYERKENLGMAGRMRDRLSSLRA